MVTENFEQSDTGNQLVGKELLLRSVTDYFMMDWVHPNPHEYYAIKRAGQIPIFDPDPAHDIESIDGNVFLITPNYEDVAEYDFSYSKISEIETSRWFPRFLSPYSLDGLYANMRRLFATMAFVIIYQNKAIVIKNDVLYIFIYKENELRCCFTAKDYEYRFNHWTGTSQVQLNGEIVSLPYSDGTVWCEPITELIERKNQFLSTYYIDET